MNKKSISVSNLTLGLWLTYVKPAAENAEILEAIPAHDDHWGDYTAEVIEETAADEIAHCMYCACIGAGSDGIERTHEEYIRHEAERMVYQLEVSIKYDLRHVADTLTKLLAALTAILNPDTITEEEEEEQTMKPETIFARIREEVEARTERSAWSHGVTAYALELVDELEEATEGGYFDLSDLEAPKLVDRALLNGAADWDQYSWGGCSLIYNGDIAERLCTPSELKRTRGGERRPNSSEEWLDTQARALFQASNRVKKSIRAALAV